MPSLGRLRALRASQGSRPRSGILLQKQNLHLGNPKNYNKKFIGSILRRWSDSGLVFCLARRALSAVRGCCKCLRPSFRRSIVLHCRGSCLHCGVVPLFAMLWRPFLQHFDCCSFRLVALAQGDKNSSLQRLLSLAPTRRSRFRLAHSLSSRPWRFDAVGNRRLCTAVLSTVVRSRWKFTLLGRFSQDIETRTWRTFSS